MQATITPLEKRSLLGYSKAEIVISVLQPPIKAVLLFSPTRRSRSDCESCLRPATVVMMKDTIE